jgi:predicted esterase
MSQTIHETQPVFSTGAALDEAQGAVILLHGRGASAESILSLAEYLPQDGLAYLAPQAAGRTWYPYSGFSPMETNEPYVSSAFQTLATLLDQVSESGIPPERIVLGGFSQGACLVSEYVARHVKRYGGLFMLSGALMGPEDSPRSYSGALDGTPVFIGGCDHDPWVTEAQMRRSAQVLGQLGGVVEIEIQPGAEHTVRQSEIDHIHTMIATAGATG